MYRISATLFEPFIPTTAQKIFDKLGLPLPKDFSQIAFGNLAAGTKVNKGENLFNRIDVTKELKQLDEIAQSQTKSAQKQTPPQDLVDINDFAKIKLCTAKVVECTKVDNSDKLLLLKLQVGDEMRRSQRNCPLLPTFLPGGKNGGTRENLKPAKIRGIESNGMILCAADGKNVIFVTPEKETESGKEVR